MVGQNLLPLYHSVPKYYESLNSILRYKLSLNDGSAWYFVARAVCMIYSLFRLDRGLYAVSTLSIDRLLKANTYW